MSLNTIIEEEKYEIREICTYHGDDGTSGYSLSEEQFEKVFKVVENYLIRAYNQALEDVEKEAESYKQGRLMDIAEQQLKSTLGHDVLYEKKMEGISEAMLHILSIIKSLKGR